MPSGLPRVFAALIVPLALAGCFSQDLVRVAGLEVEKDGHSFTLFGSGRHALLEDAEVRSGRLTAKACYPDPLGITCSNPSDILGWVRIQRDWEDLSSAEQRVIVSFLGEGEGVVRIHVEGVDAGDHGGILSFACDPDDAFLGLGERFDGVNQRGRVAPTLVEEGGIVFPGGTDPKPHLATYYPVPFYLSNRGYGLWVDVTEPTYFDLCASDPKRVSIEVLKLPFDVWIFADSAPLEVISKFTAETGRPKLSPPWVFSPWNDAVACSFVSGETNYGETCDHSKEDGLGERKVRALANLLREKNVPTSVIFSEDWVGAEAASSFGYTIVADGVLDRHLYPHMEELANHLHEQGLRFLLYYFPYLIEELDEAGNPLAGSDYAEALAKGYALKDGAGKPYTFLMITRRVAQVDLTNPAAREWYKGILRRAIALGADGWMADFGEYTPIEAVAYDGTSGLALRNLFPVQWHQLNREVWDEARPDGDYVFFTRSGYTGTQRFSPVSWPGDQNTDWSVLDGLPTIVPSALALGISGQPIWAHDIAGYTTVPGAKNTDRELFQRWTELGAFSPVMKTHHGNEAGQNWTFDRDEGTLTHFKLFAEVHTALFPYLYGLAREATETGHPIMRHLHLHYPDDAEALKVEDEYLFGPDLLVAPVVQPGVSTRRVYFPNGRWVDFWALYFGQKKPTAYKGPFWAEVDSARIPVFLRAGAAIQLLDPVPQTLSGVEVESLSTRTIRAD